MKRIIAITCATVLLTACSNEPQAEQVAPIDTITWSQGPAGIEVPISELHGPFEEKELPTTWSHDEQGAAFAATAHQAWIAGAQDDQWTQVAQQYMEPGIGRDQWAQARGLVTVEGTVDDPPKFVGYRVSSFQDDDATVVIAAQWPDNNVYGYPVQMSYATGSWRTVMPEQGKEPDLVELSDEDLSSFTKFDQNGENESE